ncbi:ribonuclease HI family protein [Candidatus Uhrbacteria bacterium]|nr:ribonuclease HI family protein [Candidatus Uhrbacteria bacterium]
MKVRIYTDGGSRGNPGPSGAGAVIYKLKDGEEGKIIGEVSEFLGKATNNQAEYTAIILGLQLAKTLNAKEVDLVMDSELAVKQINGEYRVKNQDLANKFLSVKNLMAQFTRVHVRHVRREYNKVADKLVNEAIDKGLGGK